MADKVLIDKAWYERLRELVAAWECEANVGLHQREDGDVEIDDAEGCYRLLVLPWGKPRQVQGDVREDTMKRAEHLRDLLHHIDAHPVAKDPRNA